MTADKQFNIAGKDWLTVPEAAFYCGVSESQFRHKAADLGLAPRILNAHCSRHCAGSGDARSGEAAQEKGT